MSLRVLLADESDTIKKVFELALQDFGAEVKSVHSGLDVIDVAKEFRPDILFADVLLQKLNGYDLSTQWNQHPEFQATPVVLMWSSFMELDQALYQGSGAKAHLEKPFDADQLRTLIQEHVSHMGDQDIGSFLDFPTIVGETTKMKEMASMLAEKGEKEDGSAFNSGDDAPSFDELSHLDFSLPNASQLDAAEPPKEEAPQADKAPDLSSFELQESKEDNLDRFESLDLSAPEKKPQEPSEEKEADLLAQFAIDTSPLEDSIPSMSTADQSLAAETEKEDFQAISSLDDLFGKTSTDSVNSEASDPTPEPLQSESFSDKTFVLGDDNPLKPQTEKQTKSPTPTEVPVAENSFILDPISTNATEESIEPTPQATSTPASINNEEISALVRAHVEEYLQIQIKDQLPGLLEKIIKEQLEQLLTEEAQLQNELDGPS